MYDILDEEDKELDFTKDLENHFIIVFHYLNETKILKSVLFFFNSLHKYIRKICNKNI